MPRLSSRAILTIAAWMCCCWGEYALAQQFAPASLPQASVTPSNNNNEATKLRIGPGDLLSITVFDAPELQQQVRVSDAGKAKLALLGEISLAGLTADEAANRIAEALQAKDLVLHPQVNVLIKEYGTQGVSVLGEVNKPGVYPVLAPRTLLDVLSEAGGLTKLASPEITIKRRNGQREIVTAQVNNNPQETLASEVQVQPGDTVLVPRAGIIYILGDVGRPGGYVMQDNGAMSLLQLLALGGGVNRTAKSSHAVLLHKTPHGDEISELNVKRIMQGKENNRMLSAEDILFVPLSAWKSSLSTFNPSTLATSAAGAAVYESIAR